MARSYRVKEISLGIYKYSDGSVRDWRGSYVERPPQAAKLIDAIKGSIAARIRWAGHERSQRTEDEQRRIRYYEDKVNEVEGIERVDESAVPPMIRRIKAPPKVRSKSPWASFGKSKQ